MTALTSSITAVRLKEHDNERCLDESIGLVYDVCKLLSYDTVTYDAVIVLVRFRNVFMP